jgi:hypothetical protein
MTVLGAKVRKKVFPRIVLMKKMSTFADANPKYSKKT